MNPDLEAIAAQWAQALTDAAPEAYAVALRITRLNALAELAIGLLLLTAVAILAPHVGRAFRRERDEFVTDFGNMLLVVFGSIGELMAGVGALILLLDPWNWVALFSPDLALARNALARLVGGS